MVLVTPVQWAQAVRRLVPRRRNRSSSHFDELLASTPREERFLVFWDGDVTTLDAREVPPAKKPLPPLREIRRQISEARASGRNLGWFAYSPATRSIPVSRGL